MADKNARILSRLRVLRSCLGMYEAALMDLEDELTRNPDALDMRPGTNHTLERVLLEVRAQSARENDLAKAFRGR